MEKFISPQTGSIYYVAKEFTPKTLVAWRNIGGAEYRIRVQSDNKELLRKVTDIINWGLIKNGDHISTVVVSEQDNFKTIAKVLTVVEETIAELEKMKNSFVSPQTGSIYTIVKDYGNGTLVSWRSIEYKKYRVRIQSDNEKLLKYAGKHGWGNIKGGDHVSVVTGDKELWIKRGVVTVDEYLEQEKACEEDNSLLFEAKTVTVNDELIKDLNIGELVVQIRKTEDSFETILKCLNGDKSVLSEVIEDPNYVGDSLIVKSPSKVVAKGIANALIFTCSEYYVEKNK